MTQPLLDRADSARRPFNAWFWIALAALFVLMGVAAFALSRRPPKPKPEPAPAAPAATPAPAAATRPTTPAATPAPRSPAPTRPAATPTPAPATRPVIGPSPTPPPAAASRPAAVAAPTTPPAATPAPTPPPAPVPTTPSPAAASRPAAPATAPTANQAAGRASLDEARRLQGLDDLAGARTKLFELLAGSPDAALRNEAEDLLGAVHTALVFSPRPMPEKIDYVVQIGDSLDKIARKHSTSVELLRKGNQITGSMIKVNQRLRVFSGSFRVRVDKSDNTLTLQLNDRFFKRYRVGTGQYNSTPVGTFKITDKIPQPPWWKDGKVVPYGDPANLLGTHWLAIDVPHYGIHGTWEPNTIGHQASAGCVRMLNSDVEEVFALLPIGTPVIIED
jgi:LysM repeat protein